MRRGRRGRSSRQSRRRLNCGDLVRALPTHFELALVLLHTLSDAVAPLRLHLGLEAFCLAPPFLEQRRAFATQLLNPALDHGFLLSQALILELLALSSV
jgi:hypothetical protein